MGISSRESSLWFRGQLPKWDVWMDDETIGEIEWDGMGCSQEPALLIGTQTLGLTTIDDSQAR